MRKPRFGRIKVFGQIAVSGVQRGVLHLEDDLLWLGNGIGHVGQTEATDALEIVDDPGSHAFK
jgi:hypothetical protein